MSTVSFRIATPSTRDSSRSSALRSALASNGAPPKAAGRRTGDFARAEVEAPRRRLQHIRSVPPAMRPDFRALAACQLGVVRGSGFHSPKAFQSATFASMAEEQLIDTVQQLLRSEPTLRLALLFGSLARGAAGPDSDVDLAILPDGAEFSLKDELDLQARLSSRLGREIDLVRLDLCAPALRFRVAREGIGLVGDAVDLARFRAWAGIEHAELEPQLELARRRYLTALKSAASHSTGKP